MSRSFLTYAFVVAAVVALATTRLLAPNDLMLFDQERQASYVLDILKNGRWIVQTDWMGFPASKPPLYNWIAAMASLPFGQINRFSLCFPSILATVTMALLVCGTGMKRFGWAAGLLAAVAYVATVQTDKQIVLARTDGLFALTVVLTALAGWRAWQLGRGWIWFWVAATAGMLTKGPLGLLLGAAGLGAAFWEWRTGHPASIKGRHTAGVLFLVVVSVGWLWLSILSLGWGPVVDRLFVQELAGNALRAHNLTVFPGRWFYKPPFYYLSRCLPWSVVALVAWWRVMFRPAASDEPRRFERFLFCWFWIGLIPFCLGASQRADHLMPLAPAAALLAGRQLARWCGAWTPARIWALAAGFAVVFLSINAYRYLVPVSADRRLQETAGMQTLAAEIRAKAGDDFPLVPVDSPFALQFYLNTCRRAVSPEQAAELLRGDQPVYLAMRELPAVDAQTLAQWPATGEPFVRIISNRATWQQGRSGSASTPAWPDCRSRDRVR